MHLTLPISWIQSVLREEVDVPTPDGDVRIKLPTNARSGTQLTLEGHGVRATSGKRGDEIITLQVITPEELSEAQRQALDAFRAVRPPENEPAIVKFNEARKRIQALSGPAKDE